MDVALFYTLVYSWIGLAVVIFFVLLFIPAPYGRFIRPDWGVMVNNRAGWIIMETPSLLVFSYFVFTGDAALNGFIWFFAILWIIHYVRRSFIFPFRIQSKNKKMPLIIVLMAIFFNVINGFFNGYYLGNLYPSAHDYQVTDPGFILGVILFVFGMQLNVHSDNILIDLRKKTENGYGLPRGGFFTWISCPNYFGEIIEWLGFAFMVNSLPAFSFFIWTFANLVPRALANHQWYREKFNDYPEKRKAVFPCIL